MKIFSFIFLCNILSASVAEGLDFKTLVGDGCKNEVTYSYAFYTDDGDSCDTCKLCTGTRIGFLFDRKNKNFCVQCDEAAGQCTTFKVATTFKSPWTMKFFSLISSDMVTDNTDPASIMLNGSMDGTTWATLLSTDDSSGSLFKKRMVKETHGLDNNKRYSHYEVEYKLKKKSAIMHLGASAILQVYTNECTAQIFSDVTDLNILPYTTLAPTKAPTTPGTCGVGKIGNGRCANGGCCSRYGWCAWGDDWCKDTAPITG